MFLPQIGNQVEQILLTLIDFDFVASAELRTVSSPTSETSQIQRVNVIALTGEMFGEFVIPAHGIERHSRHCDDGALSRFCSIHPFVHGKIHLSADFAVC